MELKLIEIDEDSSIEIHSIEVRAGHVCCLLSFLSSMPDLSYIRTDNTSFYGSFSTIL